MDYKVINLIIQKIIDSIQNTGIFIVRELHKLKKATFLVQVSNPQQKVEVTGNVSVDQSKTHNKIGGIILALNSLKKALKPYKQVEVTNMVKIPPYPKPLEFPKSFEISNLSKETQISNIKDLNPLFQKIINTLEKLELSPKIEVKSPDVKVEPIVNIPKSAPPVVNVEKPDLSQIKKLVEYFEGLDQKHPLAVRLSDGQKFYKALEKMAEIYAGSTFSAFQTPDGSEGRGILNRYSELKVTVNDTWDANDIDKVSTSLTYFGEETIDKAWRVRKVTKSGTLTSIRHATFKNNPNITNYEQAWNARETLEYGYAQEL